MIEGVLYDSRFNRNSARICSRSTDIAFNRKVLYKDADIWSVPGRNLCACSSDNLCQIRRSHLRLHEKRYAVFIARHKAGACLNFLETTTAVNKFHCPMKYDPYS